MTAEMYRSSTSSFGHTETFIQELICALKQLHVLLTNENLRLSKRFLEINMSNKESNLRSYIYNKFIICQIKRSKLAVGLQIMLIHLLSTVRRRLVDLSCLCGEMSTFKPKGFLLW